MDRHHPHSSASLCSVGALMDPGYLRRAVHGQQGTEDALPRGEAWLIGTAVALCTFVALLACLP